MSYEAAQALAPRKTDKSHYFTEESDQDAVIKSIKSWMSETEKGKSEKSVESSSPKMFSTEEEDQRLVAESLGLPRLKEESNTSVTYSGGDGNSEGQGSDSNKNTSASVKSEELNDRTVDSLGHIASVGGIHEHSPSLKDLVSSKKISESERQIDISIIKCSTSLHLLPGTMKRNDVGERKEDITANTMDNKVVCPILLEGKLCLLLLQTEYEVDLETSGTIEGKYFFKVLCHIENIINLTHCLTFIFVVCIIYLSRHFKGVFDIEDTESKLARIEIALDTKSLFKCLIRQINQTIKEFVLKQKLKMAGNESQIGGRRTSRRSGILCNGDDRLRAARALSGLDSARLTENKHKRDADTASLNGNTGRATRRKALVRDTDAKMEESISRYTRGNGNVDSLYRQRNGDFNDLEMALKGRNNGVQASELDALKLAQGNVSSGRPTSILRRSNVGNGMSAAAEAVRIAETENNLHTLSGINRIGLNTQRSDLDAALKSFARRTSYNSSSLPDTMRIAELEASLNNFSGGGNLNTGSINSAADAMRRAEIESLLRRNSRAQGSMRTAADVVRIAEIESAIARRSRTESMAAAAEAVTLAEMESAMNGDSMSVAAEAVRRADAESSMLRGRTDNLSARDTVRRGEVERKRRSSLTEAMRLVEMDALRRSSTGTSMAAAAEAVRLAEMEAYGNQRRQSYSVASNSINNSESLDNLSSLMRRSSGPNGSMAAAAEAVRLAELEQMLGRERMNRRRSSGINGSMNAAAEAIRLAEIEQDLRVGGYGSVTDGHVQNQVRTNGRRVSFTSDLMHDQLGKFQRN